MITDITYEGAPETVRILEGKHYKIDPAVGDGACAIHSAFGTLTSRGFFRQNARAFLADAWGTTAEDLRRHTKDDALLRDVEDVLWQDLVKPCAAQEAGIEDGNLTVREEGLMVWAEVCKVPDLRQRCIETVLEQEATYAALRRERNHVVQVFRQLCVRALEHTFLRPLLSSLGLLEEFCLTAFVLPGSPTVRNKFDALFVHENQTSRLHQSIVEHCGVSNFHVLKESGGCSGRHGLEQRGATGLRFLRCPHSGPTFQCGRIAGAVSKLA